MLFRSVDLMVDGSLCFNEYGNMVISTLMGDTSGDASKRPNEKRTREL